MTYCLHFSFIYAKIVNFHNKAIQSNKILQNKDFLTLKEQERCNRNKINKKEALAGVPLQYYMRLYCLFLCNSFLQLFCDSFLCRSLC